jgi:hypothetical protein
VADQCIVILDARGIVRFCSNPLLLGQKAAFEGEALVALLPTLALRETTPDENIAYARAWWAGGAWQSHALQQNNGPGEQMEMCLRTVVLDMEPYLLAIVRRPLAPGKAAQTIQEVFRVARYWAFDWMGEPAPT